MNDRPVLTFASVSPRARCAIERHGGSVTIERGCVLVTMPAGADWRGGSLLFVCRGRLVGSVRHGRCRYERVAATVAPISLWARDEVVYTIPAARGPVLLASAGDAGGRRLYHWRDRDCPDGVPW